MIGVTLPVKSYGGLASVYDYLVTGVDFEGWIDYLESILGLLDFKGKLAADLACGTGNTTLPLARRGYRIYGVDLSPEMLAVAEEKAKKQGLDVDFIQADMREFVLPGPVDLIICFHDGLNYLDENWELVSTFNRVRENLAPGGLFIFDLNAVTWLSRTGSEVSVLEEGAFDLIWESRYLPGDVWEVRLTAFIKEREGDYYRKFTEVHREKAYRPEEVARALEAAGLELLRTFDAFTLEPIHEKSRRHFYAARKTIRA